MQRPSPSDESRREFLRTACRVAACGALGTVAGVLAVRAVRNGAVCSRDGICRNCAAAGRCELPPAAEFRRSGRDG
jgi:hypothetical protein